VHLLPLTRPAVGPAAGFLPMLDFLMLVYGVGFFAVAILYVVACEKM
jgi:hypothetical protein